MIKYLFPILSGICASLAGLVTKIAFNEDPLSIIETTFFIPKTFFLQFHHSEYIVRGIFFLLVLFCNSLMMKYMVQSYRQIGSSLTTIINFVFNHFLSVFSLYYLLISWQTGIGYFMLKEKISANWFFGASSIVLGVILLVMDKESKVLDKKVKEKME